MPRRGKDLELLVKSIENALKTNKTAKIESPGYLKDKTTGRKREFDVLITFDDGPRTHRTAIECRKRKGKAGSPDVEGFVGKCSDNSINSMALVSAVGFTNEALAKAEHHGVQCLTLKEAVAFEWLVASEIIHMTNELRKINVNLPQYVLPIDGVLLCEKNRKPISKEQMDIFAIKLLDEFDDPKLGPGDHTMNFKLNSQVNNICALTIDGKLWDMEAFDMALGYTKIVSKTPFAFHTYTDASKGIGVTNVASASFISGGQSIKMLIVEQKDGSKQVVIERENIPGDGKIR